MTPEHTIVSMHGLTEHFCNITRISFFRSPQLLISNTPTLQSIMFIYMTNNETTLLLILLTP